MSDKSAKSSEDQKSGADINRVVAGSSKLHIVKDRNMEKGHLWTREEGEKAAKKGKFVFVSSRKRKLKLKSLPMSERGWKQAFDPESKGKYPWGSTNNIFIGNVSADKLKKIYGYSGDVHRDNETIKVNIAGKEKDVLKNLRDQRLVPREQNKDQDKKFVEAFAYTSKNISEVGTYTGDNSELKSFFNKLAVTLDAMKKSDIIDIDKLVSAYVIGRRPDGLKIEILDVNGQRIGFNGQKVTEWKHPMKNVFIGKVEGVKKFNSLMNGSGGFDISKLDSAVKVKTKDGRAKYNYKEHNVKVVDDVEKSVERTKRHILPFKVVFSTDKKTYTIPEGKIIVSTRAALDELNRELVNYAKHHKLDAPKYYEERKNKKDKEMPYSEVKKFVATAAREEKAEKKTKKSSKKSSKDKSERSGKGKKESSAESTSVSETASSSESS